MATSSDSNFIPTAEAARLSGYNPDYLSRLCRSGALKAKRVGRSWRIDRSSLERFMKQQVKRKSVLAAQTARAREREYRAAAAERQRATAAPTTAVPSPLRIVRIHTRTISIIRGPYAALGVTAVALAGGVLLAGSGVIERSGSLVLSHALTARAATIEQLSTVVMTGAVQRQELRDRGLQAAPVFARVADTSLPAASETMAYVLHKSSPSVSVVRDAYASAVQVQATLPEPRSTYELYTAASAFTDPVHMRSFLLVAYVRTGEILYSEGAALGAWYLNTLQNSGVALADFGAKTRDEIRHAVLALGTGAQNLSHTVLHTHNAFIFAFVHHAQELPERMVATLYGFGDGISTAIAQTVYDAPQTTERVVFESFGVFQGVSSTIGTYAYGVGLQARYLTETALITQELYVRRVVQSVYALLQSNDVYAQTLHSGHSMTASVFSLYQFAETGD